MASRPRVHPTSGYYAYVGTYFGVDHRNFKRNHLSSTQQLSLENVEMIVSLSCCFHCHKLSLTRYNQTAPLKTGWSAYWSECYIIELIVD